MVPRTGAIFGPRLQPPRASRAASKTAAARRFGSRVMAVLPAGPASIVAGDDFGAVTRGELLEGGQARRVRQEADAAVAEGEVGPAGAVVADVGCVVGQERALVADGVLHVLVVDHQVAALGGGAVD